MSAITDLVGIVIYGAQAVTAFWGAFCVIMVWRRVEQTRFRNEHEQSAFLDQVDDALMQGDLKTAAGLCDGDHRAIPQLVSLAVSNLAMTAARMRNLLAEHFQRDVLADLEYRLSWVNTVIKSAPMLGLLGTVVGMMGAFAKLASGDKVDPTMLAEDISFALITTAVGLSIAIPLIISIASINVRIRKLEDLVSTGLARFLDTFRVFHEWQASQGTGA